MKKLNLVKKQWGSWFSSIYLIKDKRRTRKDLLKNKIVIELMQIAYEEGRDYAFNSINALKFCDLINLLKEK
jgi:hypothetical protein